MKRFALLVVACFSQSLIGSSVLADDGDAVDFAKVIRPLLESSCLHCHGPQRAEGELRLDSREAAIAGGENGTSLVPGDPDASPLYSTTILPAGHDEIMPPEGAALSTWQSDVLRKWIEQGANWPEGVELKETPRVDFVKNVQPILEQNCVGCHKPEKLEAEYDLTTRLTAFESGESAPYLIPFQADESLVFTLTKLDAADEALMPPKSQGGPLPAESIEILRSWIEQGANWPEGITLEQKAKPTGMRQTPDDLALIERIHAKIVATAEAEKVSADTMADYASSVPRTSAEYTMVAVRGGKFLMGSPESEADRGANEGPQVEVTISPFWMGKYEVTWDEYEPFMINGADRFKWGARRDFDPSVHDEVDAVSQPTAPYTEMSFGMGQKGFPAISMTQHAANKYCQWLSAQTGHFYRLPTEAEWEYACRAGTTTAYSFGDDASQIGRYAWYYENAGEKYQKVGKKLANPWGLHDMHGNVMEWTVDQYSPDYFQTIAADTDNPLLRASTEYPRSVRGGGWDDDAEKLRSAARRGSEPSWKQQDPQLPKSLWYLTDARWLGFRIVRPIEIPTVEEMSFYWNSGAGQ